ncbi:hypothetical protein GGI04_000280 [Coemansia thaxteri]|uniref:Uncharacterized protein n=1 Tax=Coemansia thaxteri TaxID=2663907 RepID=A0A9W8B8Q5_9FUNG|nr:hypothetical protein H4R26_005440 [Coemansia thaxteri]KAJ2009628.1 hypothetical protein GGI04_000280 [Coemansia thaxteri]KAJ2333427.1 hypothetical protein GGH92_008613 [Coemansia sp. RSA 2673]KAJ2474249.1 hypothetical protein GGI02_000225 [Coemansia sp. RSA 2322]KAJ2475254.1 hypothetical protein EV174_005343 [Coemansia sp. RSA 2320]
MSGRGYEPVGDGNIGLESEIITPAHDVGGSGGGGGSNESIGYETSIPIHPKILAPLCYILPVLSGLLVVVFERRNTYVRLHAWQSILLSLAVYISSLLLFWVPFVPLLIHMAGFVTAIICIFRAWKDSDTLTFFKLGMIGDFAERQVLGATVLPF